MRRGLSTITQGNVLVDFAAPSKLECAADSVFKFGGHCGKFCENFRYRQCSRSYTLKTPGVDLPAIVPNYLIKTPM